MSTEIKAIAHEPDSYSKLWQTINQLESVLEIANEDFITMMEESEPSRKRYFRDRTHNLIGAAQALAEKLATETGVR